MQQMPEKYFQVFFLYYIENIRVSAPDLASMYLCSSNTASVLIWHVV